MNSHPHFVRRARRLESLYFATSLPIRAQRASMVCRRLSFSIPLSCVLLLLLLLSEHVTGREISVLNGRAQPASTSDKQQAQQQWHSPLLGQRSSSSSSGSGSSGSSTSRARASTAVTAPLSAKGSKAAKCPLDDVGIFLVVDEAQFPLLGHLMASMDMFLPCYGSMQVIADRKDLNKVPAWINLDRPGLRLHVMDDYVPAALRHLSGYILQQWIMMWADKFMPPKIKHVMYFDSDVVFAVPVVRDLLFDAEDKPFVGFQEYPPFHKEFKEMCSSFLGGDCPHGSSMTFFPYIYPAGALKSFRRFVTRTWSSKGFDEAFLKWSATVGDFKTTFFSQFVVMGNYILDHHPDSIHRIFCPNLVATSSLAAGGGAVPAAMADTAQSIGECATYVPVGVHMGWRYCGLFESCPSNSTDIKAFQLNTFSKKYRKWGQAYIDGAEDIVSSGYCFKHFSLSGVLKPGCTPERAALLHDEVFSYPGLTSKASVSEHVRSLVAKGWRR